VKLKDRKKRTSGKKSQEKFTFEKLIDFFRSQITTFPDLRIGDNCTYSIEDAALGAFSIFFYSI